MSGARAKVRFVPDELRQYLVRQAREGRTVTYGEVGAHFGYDRWTQGHTVALVTVMNRLAIDNALAGEPLLMALVVSKSTGRPGPGFYASAGVSPDDTMAHQAELARLWGYDWPQ